MGYLSDQIRMFFLMIKPIGIFMQFKEIFFSRKMENCIFSKFI